MKMKMKMKIIADSSFYSSALSRAGNEHACIRIVQPIDCLAPNYERGPCSHFQVEEFIVSLFKTTVGGFGERREWGARREGEGGGEGNYSSNWLILI